MKPTESDTTEDGEFSFETESSVIEVSWNDRIKDFYEQHVYEPSLIAWNDWRTKVGGAILFGFILMGTVGAYFYPEPTTNQVERYLMPFQTLDAPLGSTALGQDILAMIIHATPDMLLMILAGGIWATGVALLIGTLAGYKGGSVDRFLSTVMDIGMSIPGLPLIMVLAVVFSPENPILIGVLITINYWAGLGRSIRSQVLSIREKSYVEASRTMGTSTSRIMFKGIIPSLMPYVLVNFVNAARYTVFASVGLYFLGVLPFSTQNWGIMMNLAYTTAGALYTIEAIHWLLFPMLAILLLSLALILVAQGMDQIFNPRVRTRLAGKSESDEVTEDEETTSSNIL